MTHFKLLARWIAAFGILFSVFRLGITPSWAREVCAARYRELFKSFVPVDPAHLRIRAGIELEGSISWGVELKGVAEAILSKVLKKYRDAEIRYFSLMGFYEVTYKNKNGETKIWTIKEDSTVETNDIPLEVSTPILEDAEDFALFKEVVKAIEDLGAKSQPLSAGVHVHVEFSKAQPGEMGALAGVFSEIEKELYERFSVLETREQFASPTSSELKKMITSLSIDDPRFGIPKFLATQGKFHALNLLAHLRFGTVEFRLFNSTFDIEALELMYDFSMKLVEGIRTQNPKLVEYLTKNNQQVRLGRVAQILEMKIAKPQAEKVLERIFFEGLRAFRPSVRGESQQQQFIRSLSVLLGTATIVAEMRNRAEELVKSDS